MGSSHVRNVVHRYQTSHIGSFCCNTMHYYWNSLPFRYVASGQLDSWEAIPHVLLQSVQSVHFQTCTPAPASGSRISIISSCNKSIFFVLVFTCEENWRVSSAWTSLVSVQRYTYARHWWIEQLSFKSLHTHTGRGGFQPVDFLWDKDDAGLNISFSLHECDSQEEQVLYNMVAGF